MDRETFVHVDLHGIPRLAGRLWTRSRRGRETASFEYDRNWLSNSDRFSIDPLLALGPGTFHTPGEKSLFGALGDSAPDRWGRALMRRMERRRAEQLARAPRTLQEIDFLLMVNDEARPGALRFSVTEGGPFLAPPDVTPIPPLIELPRLLSAVERFTSRSDSDDDLRLLLAPGSSLGGARPKASVRDRDGYLAMAKFSHTEDEIDVVRWEALALTLARKAGLTVPSWRLEAVAGKPILLLRRFDRDWAMRIPFLSAMSMLSAQDNEAHSYLEIVDALRRHGAAVKEDMRELWRRIVFNIHISNTDDHLRNHGFLYAGPGGWRLAPAYDLNPVPLDLKPRVLTTAISEDDGTGTLELAMDVSGYFELGPEEARTIAAEVVAATSTWREEARALGVSAAELNRMASAFELSG